MISEQLRAARAAHWRQKEDPLLTMEQAQGWLQQHPLCLYLPRPAQLPVPAPSFVEACLGRHEPTPGAEVLAQAQALMVRLVAGGEVVPLNLFGTVSEQPDFLAHRDALPFVLSLRADPDWKHAPKKNAGHAGVSPLVLELWKAIEKEGGLSAVEARSTLGRELTEAAVLRGLCELWQSLRISPAYAADGWPARWEMLRVRHQAALTTAGATGQVTALSLLVSMYLQSVYAATGNEIETFLSPVASRSRLREAVRGLAATRQIHTLSMDADTYYFLEGGLPEFAELPAAAPIPVEAPSPRTPPMLHRARPAAPPAGRPERAPVRPAAPRGGGPERAGWKPAARPYARRDAAERPGKPAVRGAGTPPESRERRLGPYPRRPAARPDDARPAAGGPPRPPRSSQGGSRERGPYRPQRGGQRPTRAQGAGFPKRFQRPGGADGPPKPQARERDERPRGGARQERFPAKGGPRFPPKFPQGSSKPPFAPSDRTAKPRTAEPGFAKGEFPKKPGFPRPGFSKAGPRHGGSDGARPEGRAKSAFRPGGRPANPRSAKPGFSKPGISKPEFPKKAGFTKPGFTKPGFTKPGFPKPGFPKAGSRAGARDGARPEGRAKPTFGTGGRPANPRSAKPGFAKRGASKPSFPKPGFPKAGPRDGGRSRPPGKPPARFRGKPDGKRPDA